MQQVIVFVDVDDTLVRSVGSKRIPIPQAIEKVRHYKAEGAELYLWSSGGANYARSVAEELSLLDCFAGFLPKPHLYIDDQPVADWRFCQHVLPWGD
ncbi:MAG: hydrolase [Blastocatellia bacterium]|nr:hydrolase [Blastocatellia bacterium]